MMFPSLAGDAMDKIVKDQEEFEKEHQFMQVHITASPDFFAGILFRAVCCRHTIKEGIGRKLEVSAALL